jgi:hypothetical protein
MSILPKSRRRVFGVLLLAVLLATVVGAAVPFLLPGLPDPAVAGRDDLFRWVVTRDLAQETPETRVVLARRLEQEFSTGVDWSILESATEAQRRQLWKNLPPLFGAWLRDKAAAYAQLPERQRTKFMDGIFAAVASWQGVERYEPRPGDSASAGTGGLLRIFADQMQECQRGASAQERDRLSRFFWALQARFLRL